MNHMDNTDVMELGGSIGCYFDYVDENRRIAAELGGIKAIIQNIKNNFHGKYGEWSYEPVKQSLFALSSGCWVNQDICFDEGFPELAVRLMAEHGHETKIAEETMQVTKALISRSDAYRQRLADFNITDSMVHVMQVNEHDRGALDLSCENFAWLVRPEGLQAGHPAERPAVRSPPGDPEGGHRGPGDAPQRARGLQLRRRRRLQREEGLLLRAPEPRPGERGGAGVHAAGWLGQRREGRLGAGARGLAPSHGGLRPAE